MSTDDHLDRQTIVNIELYHPHVQYAVPTGLKSWIQKLDIATNRILELGWWAQSKVPLNVLNVPQSSDTHTQSVKGRLIEIGAKESSESLVSMAELLAIDQRVSRLKITCTPAQHNSGRNVFSRNKTLWASWVLEWVMPDNSIFKVFFGG